MPGACWAQSVLHFPIVVDSTPVGIAIVNPGVEAAQVSVSAYSSNGQQVAAGVQTIPGGGQIAKLGSELFGPGANAKGGVSGWIQVTSSKIGRASCRERV